MVTEAQILDELSAAVLRELLLVHYGYEVTEIKALGAEKRDVWVVTLVDGTRRVAKVSPLDEIEGRTGMQWEILEHLADGEHPFSLPRLQRTQGNDRYAAFHHGRADLCLWVLDWLEGTMLADVDFRDDRLLREVGAAAATLVTALSNFTHPAESETHAWDLGPIAENLEHHLEGVDEDAGRLCRRALDWYVTARERAGILPQGFLHHDLNDHNIIVRRDDDGRWRLAAIIDVGDALRTDRVNELGIAVAYAMLRQSQPLRAAADVVAGFAAVMPLTEDEVDLILPVAAARLALNAAAWAARRRQGQNVEYATAKSRFTLPLLEMVNTWDRDEAIDRMRHAAGFAASRSAANARRWIGEHPPLALTDHATPSPTEDLPGPTRDALAGDLGQVRRTTRDSSRSLLPVATSVALASSARVAAPWALRVTRHDLPSAPLVAQVVEEGAPPLTLRVTGVTSDSLVGDEIAAGAELGAASPGVTVGVTLAPREQSPDWPPAYTDPADLEFWKAELLTDTIEPARDTPDDARVVARRSRYLARSQRVYYREPMSLVASRDVWLVDGAGRSYLDCMNNVTSVGHAHPAVVEAAHRQMQRLNTNSRLLYHQITDLAERLADSLPEGLEMIYFTCTGSESNDLALRIARQVTGRADVCVIDGAYHGNTTAVTAISPNRFNGPGGSGAPDTTHVLPLADLYRGPFRDSVDPVGDYHRLADATFADLDKRGIAPAALFAESLLGTAGVTPHPAGYLAHLFDQTRRRGGVCVSDEVQVGLGRTGRTFWNFESQGVVPDIVTMGKPLGNGHPIAAVATTREIAERFDNGMKYFNTFAGNPVSCAVAVAVLDVIEREGLQQRCDDVGSYLHESLDGLRANHAMVGDVRGEGLYLGVDLVADRESRAPATAAALTVVERLKEEGVLTYPTGEGNNVLKIKPPMTFTRHHADILVEQLDLVLGEFD